MSYWQKGATDGYTGRNRTMTVIEPGYDNGYHFGRRKREAEDEAGALLKQVGLDDMEVMNCRQFMALVLRHYRVIKK